MSTTDTATLAPARRQKSEARNFAGFLIKLIVIVVLIRSLFVATFSIPSESMMPRLLVGDYLFVQKWPYGYSRYSFPWSPPLFEGRVPGGLPARGDVVVFKDPPGSPARAKRDIIKRVIGLPGDTVQMKGGQLILNGVPVSQVRGDDFVLRRTPNSPCFAPEFSDGASLCRYPRYRETLSNGKSYDTLDIGATSADDTRLFTVPAGHLFLLGDDRDKSADSRFPAAVGSGLGFVPLDHVVGRAWVIVFSTDGSASWLLPWTWVSAARFDRIGQTFLSGLATWLCTALGAVPRDLSLYERALTHGSHGAPSYQRLEFLGDRVLGLTVAQWLYTAYPDAPEGEMSRRFNTLVTGPVCAEIARAIGVGPHLRLGKQARDDGAVDSDNILGDVCEALIGALYLDHGMAAADAFIREHWRARVEGHSSAPRHPKSALQEWAAANNRRAPVYTLIERSGPHHAPRFTVLASLGPAGEATASAGSKQEAETAAAAALLEQLG